MKRLQNGNLVLKKGLKIAGYGGFIWYKPDWKQLKQNASKEERNSSRFDYAWQLSSDYLIDAWETPTNDIGHLINHSRHANCKLVNIISNKKLIAVVKTIQEIPLGYQLLISYSERYEEIFPDINPKAQSQFVKQNDDVNENISDPSYF